MNKYYFSSESVTEGHPKKMCDQISDAIVDEVLKKDPTGRVLCETAISPGLVVVMGEISSKCKIDISSIIRMVIKDNGYTKPEYGFDYQTCSLVTSIRRNAENIVLEGKGLEECEKRGAGREVKFQVGYQGMIFGYACNETAQLIPITVFLAHKLENKLTFLRKSGILSYLRPAGKVQVAVQFENGIPKRIESIVVDIQHDMAVSTDQIEKDIKEQAIDPVLPKEMTDENTKIYINPVGEFVYKGFQGDFGLNNRERNNGIYVDLSHGSGYGKDPMNVERSASYAARYAAKNIVAAGLANKCEIQLTYLMGLSRPASINTFGTGKYADEILSRAVEEIFDFRPAVIIEKLKLYRPMYRTLAKYGCMGREDLQVQWEKTDKANELLEWIQINNFMYK